MLSVKDFISMLNYGADEIIGAEQELTDIDSKFGDADHGITMTKVMKEVKKDLAGDDTRTFKALLDDISMTIMMINGGSAVPLWSTWIDGLSQGAPDTTEIDEQGIKTMFQSGYDVLFELSKAKVGDKTLMDTLAPATEAIVSAEGDIKAIMTAGKVAAEAGAEATVNFVSKFGRAKSYKEKTLGTKDAGAVSMKCFFVGMANCICK